LPRPRKCRKVCHFPETLGFAPVGTEGERPTIVLTIDEYETIRLIDKEGYSQEQCGKQMNVARTTVQQVYTTARRKLADALIDGANLKIEGGDFSLCSGTPSSEDCKGCVKLENTKFKGDNIMRIAVTYENGMIYQHFGHTAQFKVYDVQDGEILAAEVIDTNGSGHGALAGLLSALNIDALICGGIGGGARNALDAAGIKLYGGVAGFADLAVQALIAGNLDFNPDVQCNHHGEHHHGDHECGSEGCGEHDCGSHGCGEHGCH